MFFFINRNRLAQSTPLFRIFYRKKKTVQLYISKFFPLKKNTVAGLNSCFFGSGILFGILRSCFGRSRTPHPLLLLSAGGLRFLGWDGVAVSGGSCARSPPAAARAAADQAGGRQPFGGNGSVLFQGRDGDGVGAGNMKQTVTY